MACDKIDIEIGARLRQARVAAGLSQTELGAHLGISFQQIQKYEKGKNRIGGGRLCKIARMLRVKITYFFDGVEHLLDADAVPAPAGDLLGHDLLVSAYLGIEGEEARQ